MQKIEECLHILGTNKLAYARLFPFKNTIHVLHEAMIPSSMFEGRELTLMKFSFLNALRAKIEFLEKFGATRGSEFNQPISEQCSMSNPSQLSSTQRSPRGLHTYNFQMRQKSHDICHISQD